MAMAVAMACNTRQLRTAVNPDVVKYFMEKLLVQIYEHFDDHELIDVTFKLSNSTMLVTAHRLILSAASPYFRELFKSEKGICPLIEITEIDSDTFERLITFCYTGKTLITLENVDEMLKAAIILQLDDVVAKCSDFIIDHITDYTLQRAYDLESETQNDILSQKILKYEINFKELFQSPEFLNFDAKKMETILKSDDLNVKCEKDVFEAVKRWYEHAPSSRTQQLPGLVGLLRLTQFDTNFIMTNIMSLPGCQVLALETVAWINTPVHRSKLTLKYTNPRGRQSQVAEGLLALNIKGDEGSIYQYNKSEDVWNMKGHMKLNAFDLQIILWREMLVFTGGMRNNIAIDEVRSWNLKSKTYEPFLPMREARYNHSVVLLDNTIYAIGGRGKSHNVLKSVEIYYTDSIGWQTHSLMSTARYGAAAVTLNGKIYVMGGYDDHRIPLKSVERYSNRNHNWAKCADMNESHVFHGATVHKGKIYVTGGLKGNGTVERYDEVRDEWTKICSLGVAVSDPTFISIYNQLWAIGGWHTDYVSVYDDEKNKWIDKSTMPSVGPYYCFEIPKA